MNSIKKTHLRIVPHLDTSPNSLVFDIIERDLYNDTILKIGRFTDRFYNLDRITFKSKVVSRGHAEIFIQNDQVTIIFLLPILYILTFFYSFISVIQNHLLVPLLIEQD